MDKNIELISKTQNGNDRLLPITDCENVLNLSAKIAHDAMPSDKFISVTLPSSGSSVIAPADGYVVFAMTSDGSVADTQYIGLLGRVLATRVRVRIGVINTVFLPVVANEVVTVLYTTGMKSPGLNFVYANGSAPTNS